MPPKGEAATAARPAFRAGSDCRCEAALSIACRGSFATSKLYEPVTETAGGILGVQCTPQAYFYSLVSHQFPGLGLLVDGRAPGVGHREHRNAVGKEKNKPSPAE